MHSDDFTLLDYDDYLWKDEYATAYHNWLGGKPSLDYGKEFARVYVTYGYSDKHFCHRFNVRVLSHKTNTTVSTGLTIEGDVFDEVDDAHAALAIQKHLPATHMVSTKNLINILVAAIGSSEGYAEAYVTLAGGYKSIAQELEELEKKSIYTASKIAAIEKKFDEAASGHQEISSASRNLPGVLSKVACPAHPDGLTCFSRKDSVWAVIQHLNDEAEWSREKIADWLDELHDSGQINIEFQPWSEGEENEDTGKG